ncbi:MAG: methyltransferase domain-containing protein [Alphaproteobacteria bacterium]
MPSADPATIARHSMVDGQLRPNRINNNVLLDIFARIPREAFVATPLRAVAYADDHIAMTTATPKRTMFTPLVQASVLQALEIQPHHKVLVVAAGTGYMAAVIAALGAQVVAVEGEKAVFQYTRNNLADAGCTNVQVLQGAPEAGAPAHAPFDRIVVDAPAAVVPAALFGQLVEGGKLSAIVRGADGLMEATIYTLHQGKPVPQVLFEARCGALLPNFAQAEGFAF